jgi:prepilin-type processing-associated H-X9-DG protein
MEQQSYYEALNGPKFNIQVPWVNPSAWPRVINGQRLSMLLCPSDGMGDDLYETTGAIKLPKSNYLGIFSGLNELDGSNCTDTSRMAVFRYNKGTPISDIKDGTSNTMAAAEYLKGVDAADVRGLFWTTRAGCKCLFVKLGPNSVSDDVALDAGGFCPSSGANDQPGANLPCTQGTDAETYAGSRSRHPGGVQAVFCDGSVHFIQDGIDITPWRGLGWISDGQTVTAD